MQCWFGPTLTQFDPLEMFDWKTWPLAFFAFLLFLDTRISFSYIQPTLYIRRRLMSEKNANAERLKREAFGFIDRNKEEVARIGDTVFYFAELGMQEFKTSEYTADALRQAGFKVETGISGIPPAWMATWGSGKPVIGVHCEADALPERVTASRRDGEKADRRRGSSRPCRRPQCEHSRYDRGRCCGKEGDGEREYQGNDKALFCAGGRTGYPSTLFSARRIL